MPNKPGMWEWFDWTGEKHLMPVADVSPPGSKKPYFRVCSRGGYYNIQDDLENDEQSEWPDRWGEFVCDEIRDNETL